MMSDSDKKKYKTNYLSQVICQLTFPKQDTITDEVLKSYKDSLGKAYSTLSTIRQRGIIIEGDGSAIKSHEEDNVLWQIESSYASHVITITNESFAITYAKYIKFRDYKGTVADAQRLFFETVKCIETINRVGLRYVNQVAPKKLDNGWQQYINPKLTASLDFVDPTLLRRSMHTMFIQHDEDVKVNFNYGLFNEYFPAPISKDEFILDFDAFTDSPRKFEECASLLEGFNKVIAIYFERSITDDLREEMGVIEDGTEA